MWEEENFGWTHAESFSRGSGEYNDYDQMFSIKEILQKKNIAKERLAQELSSFAFLIVSTQSTIQS